jgi:hypothetical protein
MDWITLSIEIVGVLILVLWTFVPIQEFKLIFQRLRAQPRKRPEDTE